MGQDFLEIQYVDRYHGEGIYTFSVIGTEPGTVPAFLVPCLLIVKFTQAINSFPLPFMLVLSTRVADPAGDGSKWWWPGSGFRLRWLRFGSDPKEKTGSGLSKKTPGAFGSRSISSNHYRIRPFGKTKSNSNFSTTQIRIQVLSQSDSKYDLSQQRIRILPNRPNPKSEKCFFLHVDKLWKVKDEDLIVGFRSGTRCPGSSTEPQQ